MDKKSLTTVYRSAAKVAANKHSVAIRRDSATGRFVDQKTPRSADSHSRSVPKPRG